MLTGVLTAAYSIVDKWNIEDGVPPVWYAYFTIPVAALLLSPLALARGTWRREWQLNRVPILLVSVMMTGSYLLVLPDQERVRTDLGRDGFRPGRDPDPSTEEHSVRHAREGVCCKAAVSPRSTQR